MESMSGMNTLNLYYAAIRMMHIYVLNLPVSNRTSKKTVVTKLQTHCFQCFS